MGFLIFLNMFAHRVTMSVAIVSMVNHTQVRMNLITEGLTVLELPVESLLGDETSIHLTVIHKNNESHSDKSAHEYINNESTEVGVHENITKTDHQNSKLGGRKCESGPISNKELMEVSESTETYEILNMI